MKIKRFFNIHTLFLLVFILTCGGIAYRFFHWGVRIDSDMLDSVEGQERQDNFDLFLPLMDKEGHDISTGKKARNIVCFGNSPFADDRDSDDNLANIIAQKTGATVYNCSIGQSYLAAAEYVLDGSDNPLDIYNFYWLCHVALRQLPQTNWEDAALALGDAASPEAREVYETLWSIDFQEIDTIVIMYDASDYLAGSPMYNDEDCYDIQCFTGNLEAGIELLSDNFPWIRFIVMSPTYAYAVDDNGNYVSSDLYTYGWDILSTYVIKESESCFRHSVSFVDHFYGTINEDNADGYLTDNLHLNKAGRELVADRFIQALTYYDEED